MTYHIKAPAGTIQSAVQLPASKSVSNRILILNALSEFPCEISNLSDCDDSRVLLRALQSDEPHVDV
ncbi:MAG: 3-phosphoshikimate 1-carboxyvinyltransferase, partial [Tannerella sp.]|nr:3-phosphoshikimate 1-carboxyvinyltransferase [Tannerella sp.]